MKKLIAIMVIACLLSALVGCGNKDIFDTVYTFDYAIMSLPNGEVKKVEIEKWTDYDEGNQIQIIAKDGTVYLVHATDCVLVKKP